MSAKQIVIDASRQRGQLSKVDEYDGKLIVYDVGLFGKRHLRLGKHVNENTDRRYPLCSLVYANRNGQSTDKLLS